MADVLLQRNDQLHRNEDFEKYYRSQLAPLLHDGWETLEAALRTALPVSWRISGAPADAEAITVREHMLVEVLRSQLVDAGHKAHPLDWYPQQLAWQLNVSRLEFRSKELKPFQAWLLRETELGRVHRQEVVSMVPPLLLDLRHGHSVLDMCASPGSKTLQIVEWLHASEDVASHEGRGFCVANDADFWRCRLLASRVSKRQSTQFAVINHDARLIPETLGGGSQLQFDRVLADVPCSCDGTMRKIPSLWRQWSASPQSNPPPHSAFTFRSTHP